MFEKASLATHMGSSRHYAWKMKVLVKDINEAMKKAKASKKELDENTKVGSIAGVKSALNQFIESFETEMKDLNQVKEFDYLLEYRMEKNLIALHNDMNTIEMSIQKSNATDAEKVLHGLAIEVKKMLRKIVAMLLKAKREAKDLKRDIVRLRDRSALPTVFILHSLKVEASSDRKDIKGIKRALGDVHTVAEDFKKGKVTKTADELKQLKRSVRKFEHDIMDEFTNLIQMEKYLVVLSFRIKDMTVGEFDEMHKLLKEGFPSTIEHDLETRLKQRVQVDEADEARKDYKFARMILGKAKTIQAKVSDLAAA